MMANRDETGWVIEHGASEVSRPRYFSGAPNSWSYEHLEAVRFCREQDAKAAAEFFDDGFPENYRIAEHMWSGPVEDDPYSATIKAFWKAAAEKDFDRLVSTAMQDEWNEICSDTHCHPLDIEQLGRKRIQFRPRHWAAAVGVNLRAALLAAIGPEPNLCSDCPRVGHSTDETRCAPCPRRSPT